MAPFDMAGTGAEDPGRSSALSALVVPSPSMPGWLGSEAGGVWETTDWGISLRTSSYASFDLEKGSAWECACLRISLDVVKC